LSHAHVIYVWTHDSLALGEEGPTHQPAEQMAGLRAMPNMTVVRPSDTTETVEAWRLALTHTKGPVGVVLTRQKLPVSTARSRSPVSLVRISARPLTLTPAIRLRVYGVIAQIGKGGMGQVYRAIDTKLKRQVAIKILPPAVSAERSRLARFQREAEVLALLPIRISRASTGSKNPRG
jgi:deoxyxylulose-5-phosphate synthase